jgi:hypothetical protein
VLASVSQRRTRWLAVLVPVIAASVGAMIVLAPIGALAVAAAFGIALVLAVGQRMRGAFFVLLVGLLAGYAFLGRGFAYLGVAPVYLGEVGLVVGILAVVTILPTRRLTSVEWLIVAFMAWGAVRTVPYLSVHGLDALRDAVLWGYAAYALAIALVLTRAHVRRFVGLYARALPAFVLWVPVLSAIWFAAPAILPVAPGTDVTIPFLKFGDIAVHLAGAAAFMLAGLHRSAWRRVGEPLLWIAWLVSFGMVAVLNRGGALAITMTGLIVFYARRPSRWVAPVLIVLLLVGAVGLINPEIRTGAARRVISVDQVIENLESVFGQSDDATLQGTRRWREQWWGEIVDYTIGGPYFWGGKGFGVNLAVADGFESDPGLRAPHNAHVHVLARTGVVGLALWIALQVAFLVTLVRAARSASRLGRRTWVAIIGWITVYWAAAMVNMSFDVYLEGPQGGIVYWSIIGIGIAAAVAVRDMEARIRAESLPGSSSAPRRRSGGRVSAPVG